MDTPYRVEKSWRTRSQYGQSAIAVWEIVRTGDGPLCWSEDVTLAYRIVDLLNAEGGRGSGGSPPDGTRTYRPGSRALSEAAGSTARPSRLQRPA